MTGSTATTYIAQPDPAPIIRDPAPISTGAGPYKDCDIDSDLLYSMNFGEVLTVANSFSSCSSYLSRRYFIIFHSFRFSSTFRTSAEVLKIEVLTARF